MADTTSAKWWSEFGAAYDEQQQQRTPSQEGGSNLPAAAEGLPVAIDPPAVLPANTEEALKDQMSLNARTLAQLRAKAQLLEVSESAQARLRVDLIELRTAAEARGGGAAGGTRCARSDKAAAAQLRMTRRSGVSAGQQVAARRRAHRC